MLLNYSSQKCSWSTVRYMLTHIQIFRRCYNYTVILWERVLVWNLSTHNLLVWTMQRRVIFTQCSTSDIKIKYWCILPLCCSYLLNPQPQICRVLKNHILWKHEHKIPKYITMENKHNIHPIPRSAESAFDTVFNTQCTHNRIISHF